MVILYYYLVFVKWIKFITDNLIILANLSEYLCYTLDKTLKMCYNTLFFEKSLSGQVKGQKSLNRQPFWEGAVIITLVVFAILGWAAAIFFGKEMWKKFGHMQAFVEKSHQLVEYNSPGVESPGMYNIVLVGRGPFVALVGFHLEIPFIGKGFDYYGRVESNRLGVAVISTYIGRGKVKFQFFTNCDLTDNPIRVTSTEEDQFFKPTAVYPPHWWQRFGFYS